MSAKSVWSSAGRLSGPSVVCLKAGKWTSISGELTTVKVILFGTAAKKINYFDEQNHQDSDISTND